MQSRVHCPCLHLGLTGQTPWRPDPGESGISRTPQSLKANCMESLDYAFDVFATNRCARLQAEALVARALLRRRVAGPTGYSPAIARARATRAEARVVRSVSVAARVRTLTTHHAALAARIISGSSDGDAALIMTVISGAFLCDRCIATKTGLAQSGIATMLAQIGKTVRIRVQTGRCDVCLRADLLRSLG